MKYVLTYGIACVNEDGKSRELITEISSVTTELSVAEKLVEMLNENQLSADHLADVVNDLLAKV